MVVMVDRRMKQIEREVNDDRDKNDADAAETCSWWQPWWRPCWRPWWQSWRQLGRSCVMQGISFLRFWCLFFSEKTQNYLWCYIAWLYSLFGPLVKIMRTMELCDSAALFSLLSETNKHQNLMRHRHPIGADKWCRTEGWGEHVSSICLKCWHEPCMASSTSINHQGNGRATKQTGRGNRQAQQTETVDWS